MGLVTRGVRSVLPVLKQAPLLIPQWQSGIAQLPDQTYQTYAREGYSRNELVFACIEEKATSAAEPSMIVRTGRDKWTDEHDLLTLLDKPNPFMDRFELWATIIMHREIAGNAYILKVRSGSQRVVQLWVLRPDRVKVVPDAVRFISHYEYAIGGADVIRFPVSDVIHFKTRHSLNDFYGMPPIMPISGRVDIDNYMRDFVKAFFQNAGVPAGLLSTKKVIPQPMRDEIKRRFRDDYGGPSGWHDLMVLDGIEASFTPMTQQLGQRGLVVPELDEISEARICSVFGVPQSLVGTRTSYQNGGYANKRAEEQHFWTGTLVPLYKELAGKLNLNLIDDFSGVEEIAFDLSDVRALQPDLDTLHARWRLDYMAGLVPLETAQNRIGLAPDERDGVYLVPANLGITQDWSLEPKPEPKEVEPPVEGEIVPPQLPAPAQPPPQQQQQRSTLAYREGGEFYPYPF